MIPADPQFVTDPDGRRVAVLIGIEQYEHLLDALEEVESIHAYDAAHASGDESLPFDEAVREVERVRGAG